MTTTVTGQKVLVTGTSSGIGASTALLLAQNNIRVILAARRLDLADPQRSDPRCRW